MTIKAIPTRYNGYEFRSRLEARWAIFFDSQVIRYEYEAEGFNLGDIGGGEDTLYLPDFWLPQVRNWAEVKPTGGFDREARLKIAHLVAGTGHDCIELEGPPDYRSYAVMENAYWWPGAEDSLKHRPDFLFDPRFVIDDKLYTESGDCLLYYYKNECGRLFRNTGFRYDDPAIIRELMDEPRYLRAVIASRRDLNKREDYYATR